MGEERRINQFCLKGTNSGKTSEKRACMIGVWSRSVRDTSEKKSNMRKGAKEDQV